MNRLFSAGSGGGENVSSELTAAIDRRRIRALGAVLDMPFTQSIYKPLLDRQPRDGVKVRRDLPYGAMSASDWMSTSRSASQPRLRTCAASHAGWRFHSRRQGRAGEFRPVLRPRRDRYCRRQLPSGARAPMAGRSGGRDRGLPWLRRNAAQLGVDPKRIFLAGESAGAAHVAAATLVRRFHPKEGLLIAGTVLISGVYNAHLERLARVQFGVTTPDPRNEAYFGSDFERYRQMSTVELIDAPPAAPLLITYAELDLLRCRCRRESCSQDW